jgi:hypothetical protein
MKIETTMSRQDWERALTEVWKNARDFDEILTFGLENNFISSSDIIHASDMYRDPDNEYTDEELQDIIEKTDLDTLIGIIRSKHGINDIIDSFGADDILDSFDDDDLLDKLENTWALKDHDEDVRAEYYDEVIDEVATNIENETRRKIQDYSNYSADDLHRLLCDIVGCSYYDSTVIEQLRNRISNNTYVTIK